MDEDRWRKWDLQSNFGPGASSLIPEVLGPMHKPYVNPWNPDYMEFYEETCSMLQKLFNTRNDVIIQIGPIRVAMDTAINAIVEPGDKVIIVRNGFWSDQFVTLVTLHGGEPVIVDEVWGRQHNLDKVREVAREYRGKAKAIVLTHVETSTGIVNKAAEVGRIARENDLLYVLDCAQSLGGMEVRTDDWNVDLCIGGAHKCMSSPAGTAFLAISPRAWKAVENRKTPMHGWYTNLNIWKTIVKWEMLITWPTSLMFGLRSAIEIILKDPQKVYSMYRTAAKAIRIGVSEMGLRLIPDGSTCPGCDSPDRICADTATAILYPPGVDFQKMWDRLYPYYNVAIGGGLGQLKTRNFRLGPTGLAQVQPGAVMQILSAVGMCMKDLGVPVEVERGLEAASRILRQG